MRIIIVCICAIKRKGDLFNARGGDVFPASRRMGLRGTVVTGETASLPILVGGGVRSRSFAVPQGRVVSRGRRNRFVLR